MQRQYSKIQYEIRYWRWNGSAIRAHELLSRSRTNTKSQIPTGDYHFTSREIHIKYTKYTDTRRCWPRQTSPHTSQRTSERTVQRLNETWTGDVAQRLTTTIPTRWYRTRASQHDRHTYQNVRRRTTDGSSSSTSRETTPVSNEAQLQPCLHVLTNGITPPHRRTVHENSGTTTHRNTDPPEHRH